MTGMEQGYRTSRRRSAAPAMLLEYALILGVLLLVGAIALLEVSGSLDSFVHSISFTV